MWARFSKEAATRFPIPPEKPRDRFWQAVDRRTFSPVVLSCYDELRRTISEYLFLNKQSGDLSLNPYLTNLSGPGTKHPEFDEWQLYITTRKGTQSINSPRIESGVIDGDRELNYFISVSATSDGSSRYDHQVLPGRGRIDFHIDGRILGGHLGDPHPSDPLSDFEIEDLTLIFTKAQDSLGPASAHLKVLIEGSSEG